MKTKRWFKSMLSGAMIGVGAAIPGVSGGTIAVIISAYQDIVWAVSNIFKSFKKSFFILLPVLLGIIIALIPCIILFNLAFQGFIFGIVCLFAGFIIGSFPGIFDYVKGKPVKKSYYGLFVGAIVIALALGICSALLGNKINLDSKFTSPHWWFYLLLIPVGFLASTALVVPGISGSMILLVLGFYKPLLKYTVEWCKEILTKGDWSHAGQLVGIIGCLAVGILIGFFVVSKVMNYLLKEKETPTYYAIIGFIVGSTITLFFNDTIYNDCYLKWMNGTYPGLKWFYEVPIGIVLLLVGALLTYQLVKYQRKKEETCQEK